MRDDRSLLSDTVMEMDKVGDILGRPSRGNRENWLRGREEEEVKSLGIT